ncbi:MAG: thioredoxin family protein [Rhodovibrio sp.]|nr:thioredoxin family protein [Rhodovibrio sp.]
MDIKVLGPGCKKCGQTEEMIRSKASELSVDATVEKVTDTATIMEYGVMSTPAVAIDGKLVHSGGKPSERDIEGWLTQGA